VLYTSQHDATFWSLGTVGARKVIDLWAERSAALGAEPDVAYVLVFENRGPEVGATIAHPHGQIYAFDHVPDLPRTELARGDQFDHDPGERLVAAAGRWQAYVPAASAHPYGLMLTPSMPVPDLPSLDPAGRDELAALLVDVLERLDVLFDAVTPYMLWIHQRPFDDNHWPDARLHIEIVCPWRSRGVARFVAAGELGSGVYFNPVTPQSAAAALRAVVLGR
jgi:UDPglucose--hexose-1-phosphate uridylyltransferase